MNGARRDLPANRRVRPPKADPYVVDAPAERVDHGVDDAPRKNVRKGSALRAAKAQAGRAMDGVRSRLQAIRTAVGIVVVIAASVGLAWGIRHHVMTSPRFAVKTIRVDGTARRTPEQVVETAGLAAGVNIFAIDLENARRRILQDPWIESATVDRKLPSTLTVQVVEREAAAVVVIGVEPYLCTHTGEPFKRLESGDPSSVPVITGLVPEDVASNRDGAVKRIRDALELLNEYERRGPSKEYPAQEVHLGDDGTMRMTVGRNAVTIELGSPPYRRKVLRAAQVLGEVGRRKADPAVVFLDNEAHPERVVVRMR
jgi:cell division protein FtsQ